MLYNDNISPQVCRVPAHLRRPEHRQRAPQQLQRRRRGRDRNHRSAQEAFKQTYYGYIQDDSEKKALNDAWRLCFPDEKLA